MKYNRLEDIHEAAYDIGNEAFDPEVTLVDDLIDSAYQLGRKGGWTECLDGFEKLIRPAGDEQEVVAFLVLSRALWAFYFREEFD